MADDEAKAGSRKLQALCLHGFRTSGAILERPISKWPKQVQHHIDLFCVDAPFPAQGKSDVEGRFDPPYYEWVFFDKGAELVGALPGLQEKGLALTKVPKIKFVIIISGRKLRLEELRVKENIYANPISIPNLHFLGKEDLMRPHGLKLLECYKDPTIIHHPKNHVVPNIAPESLPIVLNFIDHAKKIVLEEQVKTSKGRPISKM